MSDDLDKLQRLLEQATAAEGASEDDLEPEAASLRAAWISFGRLLEAAQPLADSSALSLAAERQRVSATPPPARPRRRLLPAAALLAASLLICAVTFWMFETTNRLEAPSPSPQQTASTDIKNSKPRPAERQAAPAAEEPQWDDSLDEQIAQVNRRMIYAQQDLYAGTGACGLVQYQMEQIQRDLEGNEL